MISIILIMKTTSTTKQNSIDFGVRRVSKQNFSHIICLPSVALQSLGNPEELGIQLVQQEGQQYIKLVLAKKMELAK